MKNLSTLYRLRLILLLLIGFSLTLSGCAPPPATSDLQQKIDGLLDVQKAQAEELAALKHQLAQLGQEVPTPVPDEPSAIAPPPSTAETTPVLTAAAADIDAMSKSASLYLASFAAMATGRMAEAEAGFRDFTQRYPDHAYRANANYWLAEALFALQQPQQAETLLLDIIDSPQQQEKAPAAMARLVRYYRKSGAADNATALLRLLSTRYPESPELKRLQQDDNLR